MLSLAVAALSFSANGHTAPLMKLRGGGLPSVEDTQKVIGAIGLASGLAGFAFPKENLDVYEFTSPLEDDTVSFGRMNFGAQIVVGTMLLSPNDMINVFAAVMYGWSAAEADNLKAPRLPILAWAAFIWATKAYSDVVPDWALPAALVASGLHGTFFPQEQADMYKIGSRVGPKEKARTKPISKQATAMSQLANNAWQIGRADV